MFGIWGNHANEFLYVAGTSIVAIFGIPMALWPIHWARVLRWTIPEHTDLAVYYGRCLGCLAFAIGVLSVEAARTAAVQPFCFQLLLLCFALMVPVHIYGAIKNIQPVTETYEIGFWLGLVLLTLAFWPDAAVPTP